MKKRVYLAQPTNMLANSIYLPYTVGTIAAYAWQFEEIQAEYELMDFLFFKTNIGEVVSGMEMPYLVAFSNYMWNVQYNLRLAEAIKQKWPGVLIVFGGTQIPEDSSYLAAYDFIDYLLFGEGEIPFTDLLRCLSRRSEPKSVRNLAFRDGTSFVLTERGFPGNLEGFPSPYTGGFFDGILHDDRYKDIQFDAVLETNRGCPYKCLYCAWGDSKAPLRQFSMEKVKAELCWFAQNEISYVVCADGNFGIFPRDEEIADEIVRLKKQFGFPKKFSTTAAKNKDDLTFRINKKLNDMDMNKGVSVSVQSLTPEVLKIIGRTNMTPECFSEQLKRYREAGIVTYTDLILGLPGESFDSFCSSLFSVIEAGQHYSVNISRCELLPNSPMYTSDVIKKYGIKTIRSFLFQNHSMIASDHTLGSRSEIVVETNAMKKSDWKRMFRLATVVQGMHYFGLLRYAAICARQALGVSYQDFYMSVYRCFEDGNAYLRAMLDHVTGCADAFLAGKGDLKFSDERFGDIYYPFEEGLFLCAAAESERFFKEIKPYLSVLFRDQALFEDLFQYQICVLNLPGVGIHEHRFRYDWQAYFGNIYGALPRYPEKKEILLQFVPETYLELPDYAKEIVWFGKRNEKMIISTVNRLDSSSGGRQS